MSGHNNSAEAGNKLHVHTHSPFSNSLRKDEKRFICIYISGNYLWIFCVKHGFDRGGWWKMDKRQFPRMALIKRNAENWTIMHEIRSLSKVLIPDDSTLHCKKFYLTHAIHWFICCMSPNRLLLDHRRWQWIRKCTTFLWVWASMMVSMFCIC